MSEPRDYERHPSSVHQRIIQMEYRNIDSLQRWEKELWVWGELYHAPFKRSNRRLIR